MRTADFSTAPYPASSAGTLEKTVICQRHHQEDVHCSVHRHSHHGNIINHHDNTLSYCWSPSSPKTSPHHVHHHNTLSAVGYHHYQTHLTMIMIIMQSYDHNTLSYCCSPPRDFLLLSGIVRTSSGISLKKNFLWYHIFIIPIILWLRMVGVELS